MDIVILGLSVTSSWGNGHATVWRCLVSGLTRRGHRVRFLERDVPWYSQNRDLPKLPAGDVELYQDVDELKRRFGDVVCDADAVIVGSYVPDGIAVGEWVQRRARGVTAFYDIDTPVTLAALEAGPCEYVSRPLIAGYDMYLSFAGGPLLRRLEREFGSPRALPLHCCVDPQNYYPQAEEPRWDLGYMGTYSDDRQPRVRSLLLEPATRWADGRFIVAGPQYPASIDWPRNVQRAEHLPPSEHRAFYNHQRFTLNITRDDMIRAGYSPSVRLFEAAACGVPIISDFWEGLGSFFQIGDEILVARDADDVLGYLRDIDEAQRVEIGRRARAKVLAHHTAERRAAELEAYLNEARGRSAEPAAADAASVRAPSGCEAPAAKRNGNGDGIADAIAQLGPWFHNLELPGGRRTAPDHPLGDFPRFKWRMVADHLPEDLSGWSALDIGCNAGFYSFELARRGARVLGVDHDEHYLTQAKWAAQHLDPHGRVRFRQLPVYELNRLDESFDLVIFMGVFYHLRYPLLGLDLAAQRTRKLMVFQTLTMPGDEVFEPAEDRDIGERDDMLRPGWPKMAFIEHRLANDPTNWWAPNHAAVEAMLRSAGLSVVGRPGHEIYLCEPAAAGQPREATAEAAVAAGSVQRAV